MQISPGLEGMMIWTAGDGPWTRIVNEEVGGTVNPITTMGKSCVSLSVLMENGQMEIVTII